MIIFHAYRREADRVWLDAEDSGHCVRVLRHREGDEVNVIDGEGSLLHCVLEDASPREACARIVSEEGNFGSHPYSLVMAVCPTKNIDRYEWFVEKAVEIGVDRIVPLIGERSERKQVKTDRLGRIALSAAKQSLKGRVPEISEPVSVAGFIGEYSSSDSLRLIAYCEDDESMRRDIAEVLEGNGRDVVVLIGPEGDFSPSEVSAALGSGWIPVHLGASRLRTETAAVVAVTAVYLENLK